MSTELRSRKIQHLERRCWDAKTRPFESRFRPILLKQVLLDCNPEGRPPMLRLEATPEPPKTAEVEELLTGLMLERELHAAGEQKSLSILKKVYGTDNMAVDGLRRLLPEHDHIRTVALNSKTMSVTLAHFLDLASVRGFVEDLGFQVAEGADKLGRKTLEISRPCAGSQFTVGPTYVTFNHAMFGMEGPEFDESLTRFIEFICLLPYKKWAAGSNLVRLNDYLPVFEIIAPETFKGVVKTALLGTYDMMMNGSEGEKAKALHETVTSKAERQAGRRAEDDITWALNSKFRPPHVSAITMRDESGTCFVCFNCDLDFPKIKEMLGEKGFSLTERSVRRQRKTFANKASHFAMRKYFESVTQRTVVDSDGKTVLEFDGENSVFVKLDEETFEKATRVLDAIHSKLMFCTPELRDSEHGTTGLFPEERAIINAVDSLARFYSFFLYPVDARAAAEAIGSGALYDLRGPHEWVMHMLKQGEGTFQERVYDVLQILDRRIRKIDFMVYGSETETQEKASQLYARLQLLTEDFAKLVA
jgi:hypothetical protein